MPSRKSRLYPTAMLLLVAVYTLRTMRLVFLSDLNHDEGYYLYVARLVYQGKLPYADFALFQGPLLGYVYGLPQSIFGGSILLGRLTSFALGTATLLFCTALARRLAGDIAAIFTGAMLCATSTFLWVFSTTRTEPLTAFLVALSLYSLFGLTGPVSEAVAVSAMVWASAARISYLLATVLLLGIILYRNRKAKLRCIALVLLTALQFAILLGIPLVVAKEKMLFDVLGAQLFRYRQFRPHARFHLRQQIIAAATSVWDHLTRLYIGVTSATVSLISFVLLTKPLTLKHIKTYYLIMLLLAVTIYIPQLTVFDVGEVYFLASALILAIIFGCAVGDLYCYLYPGTGRNLVLAMAIGLVITQAAMCIHDTRWHASIKYWPIAQLRDVAQRIAKDVSEEEQIVTFSTYIAIDARRNVAPGFETSWFSFFPGLSDERAAELKLVNMTLFNQALRDPKTAYVLLTDNDLTLLARAQGKPKPPMPPVRPLTEAELFALLEELKDNYVLTETIPNFGQFHDNLYILKKRPLSSTSFYSRCTGTWCVSV